MRFPLSILQLLAPLSSFATDLSFLRGSPSLDQSLATILAPHLLSLPEIGKRHRRTLAPVIKALLSVDNSSLPRDLACAILDDAVVTSDMDATELDAIKVAVELRLRAKAAEHGAGVVGKAFSEEIERRE